MHRSRPKATIVVLVAAFSSLALGCGDAPKTSSSSGGAATPLASAADAGALAATLVQKAPEYNEADFVETDRNRDPFRTFRATSAESGGRTTIHAQRKVVLERFSVDELKLVAIVMGGDYPRAMLVDPLGKGHVIKRGDFVGRPEVVHTGGSNGADYQLNWRVDRVRDGDVVFVREDPAQPGIAPATRVIPLRPEGDLKPLVLD